MIEEIQDEFAARTESDELCVKCRAGSGIRVWSRSLDNGELTCTVTEVGFEHRVQLQNLRSYTVDYELKSKPNRDLITYETHPGRTWQIEPASNGGNAEEIPPSFDSDDKWDRLFNRLGGPKRRESAGVRPTVEGSESETIRTKVRVWYLDVPDGKGLQFAEPKDDETVIVSIHVEIEV